MKPAWTTRGRGVRRKPGEMNKLECQYAEHLEARRIGGEILWWSFEAMKLKLAPSTFYTPDFIVMLANGEIEAHESKGHWEDDARVKIKVAAEKFPFRFVAARRLAKKNGGGWEFESF
jgi:hypothetical protein